ncbi:hypothetical protein CPCC7001_2520 [Cyanobium sp. PCC 7001]|nr:hypothetical protein CPCC7001_2132 [Cyanobium sp. PCC 7001]EDY39269.1 hypothetical protein CPCC7001_2149 [Cyanobium sp. PCC 7001]EDY39639.1 hypothetical protein CPCC7001_2520 [Cyanobium sp. PCC 7001]
MRCFLSRLTYAVVKVLLAPPDPRPLLTSVDQVNPASAQP